MSENESKVFLVTGASKGVGAEIVRTAVAQGHRVVVLARDRGRLDASIAGLPSEQVLALPVDVTQWGDLSRAADAAVRRFGQIDVAVANAGVALPVSFFGSGGSDPGEWQTMVDTNVLGTALTARAALPKLVDSRGHLVIIGSVAGRVMRQGLYSATKWGISAMAASIRAEAVGTGVRVTIVQPGVIDSQDVRDDLRERPKIDPATVANAVMYAVDQPSSVDINEIVLRPTGQPADC